MNNKSALALTLEAASALLAEYEPDWQEGQGDAADAEKYRRVMDELDTLLLSLNSNVQPAEELPKVSILLSSGETIEQAVIREKDTGLFFTVDASYAEQDAGAVHSPYGNGVIDLEE